MKIKKSDMRPFASLIIIFVSMLTLAFSKMEVRRLGYSVLKNSRTYKIKLENRRMSDMTLAKLIRPDRIEDYAHNRLFLKKAEKGQIVQISGQTIALRH